MNKTGKTRIAVVNSHPIQYFAPLYAYLNATDTLSVDALYCSDISVRGGHDPGFGQLVRWNVDLLSGYRSVFLGSRACRRTPGGFWSLVSPEVWREIRGGGYDVVWLHGHGYAADVLAFLAAKSKGIPVLMRSETHLGLARPTWRRHVRDNTLALFYKFVDGFLPIGSANLDYYRSIGVPEQRSFLVPYTVDNARFSAAATLARGERASLRGRYRLLDDVPVVVYASKFVQAKRPQDVLHAAARLRDEGAAFQLLMIGSGPLERELRDLAARLRLDSVVFGGFVNQAELPAVLAAADVFVLPSEYEPWGLIVNEAMCAALPIVASANVGCARDLIRDGENGFLFAAGDTNGLLTALRNLVKDESLRRRFGQASLDRIRQWSYAECLRGLLAAVSSVTNRRAEVNVLERARS